MGKKNLKKIEDMDNLNICDDHSETSSISTLWANEFKSDDDNIDDNSADLNSMDEKLDEIIQEIDNKDIYERISGLKNFKKFIQSHYTPELLSEKILNVVSCLEKCIKREQLDEERVLALEVITLLFIETSFTFDAEHYWKELSIIIENLFTYDPNPIQVREMAVLSYSMITFILEAREQEKICKYMSLLESLFKRSSPKPKNVHTQLAAKSRALDKHVPLHVETPGQKVGKINNFRASALKGWTLMLTICNEDVSETKIKELVKYVTEDVLGDSTSPLPLKTSAAICLAVCNEIYSSAFEVQKCTSDSSDCEITLAAECIQVLEALIADNPKYTSKRDQRFSRGIFRRVLHSFLFTHPSSHLKGNIIVPTPLAVNGDIISSSENISPSSSLLPDTISAGPDSNSDIKGILKTQSNSTLTNEDIPDSDTIGKNVSIEPEVNFNYVPIEPPSIHEDVYHGVGGSTYQHFRTEVINFGDEVLIINGWVIGIKYEMFCMFLGHGTNLHLRENELIRQIFNLGPVKPQSSTDKYRLTNVDRIERKIVKNYIDKDRTLERFKARKLKTATRSAHLLIDEY